MYKMLLQFALYSILFTVSIQLLLLNQINHYYYYQITDTGLVSRVVHLFTPRLN